MLVLNPPIVKFDFAAWTDVSVVIVDRLAEKVVAERGDLGPHITLADVPEQRILIRITREIARDDLGTPRPSQSGELSFHSAPASTDGLRRRVRATCVVLSVTHEVGRLRGALQTITLLATSADGVADPLTIEDSSDGTP